MSEYDSVQQLAQDLYIVIEHGCVCGAMSPEEIIEVGYVSVW